jgi:hypothetical protein
MKLSVDTGTEVTVTTVLDEIPPTLALIVAEPATTPLTRPPGATVAVGGALDVHAADVDRSAVVPFE